MDKCPKCGKGEMFPILRRGEEVCTKCRFTRPLPRNTSKENRR